MTANGSISRDGVADRAARRLQDKARARELYKYFQPTDPAFLANEWMPAGKQSDEPHKAASPNVTLTAYAQYIAIRLNSQRALISLIADEQLYDVAEATKTININNTVSHVEDSAALWVGCQTVPKKDRLCSHVAALELPDTGYAFFISNDMTEDERFKDLPFVSGPPYFRFYAGTPLVTKDRINIGSVFILDDKPRNGLDDDEKEFLGTMGTVIVGYLRTNRYALLGRKGTRLTQSVRLFGDGRPSFVLGGPQDIGAPRSAPVVAEGKNMNNDTDSNSDSIGSTEGSKLYPGGSRHSKESLRSLNSAGPIPSIPQATRMPYTNAERSTLAAFMGDDGQEKRDRLLDLGKAEFNARGWTMGRAANLIREAIDIDDKGGVIFFDANQDFTKFVEDNQPTDEDDLSTSDNPGGVFDAHFQMSPNWDPPSSNEAREAFLGIRNMDKNVPSGSRPKKLASVIASSTAAAPFAIGGDVNYDVQAHQFPAWFLQRLLKKYPGGKIWSFDAVEDAVYQPQVDDELDGNPSARRQEQIASRSTTLRRFFPRVRHLIFVPLWDASKSQWAAGCFVWNTNAAHILEMDTDLVYIEGLCRAVMTEISRLDTIQADQQKSDFIGSISHELRSPLHGILASLEFLHDTNVDPFQKNLVSTIETCGRTLLDTINHVLDYSKINSFGRDQKREGRKKSEAPGKLARTKSFADTSPLVSTYASTNIATILEEVIEGVKIGQQYRETSIYGMDARHGSIQPFDAQSPPVDENGIPMSPSSLNEGVDVDLDISPGNWTFLSQPGALRRCFMNIFGNALKYTEKGNIDVSLRLRDLAGRAKMNDGDGKLVVFQVADTGRGISAQFLRSKIYTPFSQEDSLAPGTGLGLSLVRSIVAMMNGRIDIESRPGRGTTVTIALPLLRPPVEEKDLAQQSIPNPLSAVELERPNLLETHELTVSIFGIEKDWSAPKKPGSRVLKRVAGYVRDWLDLPTVPWSEDPLQANVVIVEEIQIGRLVKLAQGKKLANKHLVCICPELSDELPAEGQLRTAGFHVHRISKPVGPRKIEDILRLCLEITHEEPTPKAEITDPTNLLYLEPSEPEVASLVEKLRGLIENHPDWANNSSALNDLKSLLGSQQSMAPNSPQTGSSSAQKAPAAGQFMTDRTTASTLQGVLSPNSVLRPPLERTKSSTTTTPLRQPGASTGSADDAVNPQPRVLLVEDNKINLRLLQTFMSKRQLRHVESAENGRVALDAVKHASKPFDIIFMDISMPVMNGFEATSAIREYEIEQAKAGGSTQTSTIVALTGLASAEDQEKASEVGMDVFLIKPVSFKEVAKMLDNWGPREV